MLTGMPDSSLAHHLLWETIQQQESYPIFRLAYLSTPTHPFTDEDFDDIEQKSVEANNARDVTGLLVVEGDRVIQILEGREAAVRDLFSKIEADERHTVTKLVSECSDTERMLLTWSMVVRHPGATPPELLDQFRDLYKTFQDAPGQSEITLSHIDLLKTLSLFGALPA